MKSFQERNQVVIGSVSMVVLTLFGLIAFYADSLPIIGGGTTYVAHFSEAAGVLASNEVRAAGVQVGTVTDVELDGDHVKVSFRVRDAWVGDRTTVAIRIKTLLGAKYLALDPQGERPQDPDEAIPVTRTVAPYDINQVFDHLSATVTSIDTRQLADSLRVLSDTFQDSPRQVRSALDGLSALSKTISSRDEELARLLANTQQISRTFADRDDQVEKLLQDGNLLLGEIRGRRDAISALLSGTRQLAAQLSGLVTDNSARLRPALEQLDRVNTILQRNQDNLNQSLALAGPFYRLLGNAVGNGRWLDTYICGLLPPPGSPPDTVPDGNCKPPKGRPR
ncbi:MCE family protein [Amycolatopsis anabasis]|uniref:MCE family protein n=1 Tax=Amycolatopsis anabasis TaxID=1840409 RepID=UPI001FE5C892|nr:MCE family protein [Amycolatopsis anabasis]